MSGKVYIVPSLINQNRYFLFRDDGTEIRFEKRKGVSPKVTHQKLTELEKQAIKEYFK